MTKNFNILSYIVVMALIVSCNSQSENSEMESASGFQLFTLLAAEETNIYFANNIIEDEHQNFRDFDYMYNGSGVAIGDINNDGLMDIYFTGNSVDNKLFLNEGNMVFNEITQSAGVTARNSWCTGVTMVDINDDGWLDIYVCRSYSDGNADARRNLLYINNGNNTFTESAKAYGIDDLNYSSQATFFDYDRDGDLDMFLGNHPRDLIDNVQDRLYHRNYPIMTESDKLFRNNGDETFTDVTVESGILNYGFALGIMAGDMNNDGWTDIYVANDYEEADMLYINNQDGTFTNTINKAVKHISNFAMGADLADYNNDGLLDIVVLDMMAEDNYRQKTNMSAMAPSKFWDMVDNGFHHQYMRNSLQLNNGNGSFSEIGQLAGINYTDWSWAALFADFNNDGFKDLIVTNGYRRDSRNNDFRAMYKEMIKEHDNKIEAIDIAQYLELMPVNKISNYYYENTGDLTFINKTREYGFDRPSFSNGASYADLDNDGDLDLVINNLVDDAFIYRNNLDQQDQNNYLRIKLNGKPGNSLGLGATVTLFNGDDIQYQEMTSTRGYLSSVENILHFGLANSTMVDKIEIKWLSGTQQVVQNIASNQTIEFDEEKAGIIDQVSVDPINTLFTDVSNRIIIDFTHQENEYDDYIKESLLPHKMSQFGPNIATGDVNNDGKIDFYIGGASGQAGVLFIQKSNLSFEAAPVQPWHTDKKQEDIGAVFFDSDGDNDLDLYVVSGGNEFDPDSKDLQDRLYLNDGEGNFTKSVDVLPAMRSSGSCVVPGDYDKDGDIDLFVGGRLIPGNYAFPARSYILNNNGGRFTDVTESMAPGLVEAGMVTSALWTDFDKDGAMDLFVVGEWMPLSLYHNENGNLVNSTEKYNLQNTTGWWNRIVQADIDGDGDQDYIVGNLGLNYKYKASVEEPLHVYCSDFDRNGTMDIVLGYYNQGECYPVRGRECTSQQIPFIKEKFENYESFGLATLYEVYGDDLNTALHQEAKLFESCYLENKGEDGFAVIPLPTRAQFSTVFGIIPEDFDKDGHMDLIIAGNLYVSEV
ncbi:MAG: VCBS repeat-containing protein [Bacteroidetes bacterium]|nr:VCBS repeat-containing protein [Bacteroidota bacterium]